MKDAKVHERWYKPKVTTAGNDIALIKLPFPAVTVNEDQAGNIVLPVCLDWTASGVRHVHERRENIITGPHFSFRCNLIIFLD